MYLTYENDVGIVRMSGSGDGCEWRILDVSGLGLAPRSAECVTYSGEAGQKTLSVTSSARTITIKAEVAATSREMRARILSRTLRVFADEGVLYVVTHERRRAKCYLNSADEGERYGGKFRQYVFQLVCDSPYFEDVEEVENALFYREDLLNDTEYYWSEEDEYGFGFASDGTLVTTESGYLTKRTQGGTILNDGDAEAEGVLTIAVTDESEDESGVVTIANSTTGSEVKINVTCGETYTIDVYEREIYDQDGNERLDVLDEESYISDLVLQRGENEIAFSYEGEIVIDAKWVYRRKWAECTD